MTFTIDSKFDQYFHQRFKGSRQSAWILSSFFSIIVVFEAIRFRDTGDSARLIFLSFAVLFFLLIAALLSIFTYFKLTRVVTAYRYEQRFNCWHFTTYRGAIIITANDVIESQGELAYIDNRYKSKIFIIKGKKFYFPIEKLE